MGQAEHWRASRFSISGVDDGAPGTLPGNRAHHVASRNVHGLRVGWAVADRLVVCFHDDLRPIGFGLKHERWLCLRRNDHPAPHPLLAIVNLLELATPFPLPRAGGTGHPQTVVEALVGGASKAKEVGPKFQPY